MKRKQLLICIAVFIFAFAFVTCDNGNNDPCKNGHDWEQDGKAIVEPTCLEKGEGAFHCTRCDATDDHHDIPALGHDHTSSLVCKRDDCDHQYEIGDTGPGGGIIFYVADGQDGRQSSIAVQAGTGFSAYTAYYLEAAPSSTTAQWGSNGVINGGTTFTSTPHADASIIGNGRKDTQLIIAHLATTLETGRAAQLASSADFGGKNDWFLPSLGELYQLYLQRNLTGIGITTGWFWSSTQNSSNLAWGVNFANSGQNSNSRSSGNQVRAIRAF